MDSIKDVLRSSLKVPELDKHLKKARRHIGRNFVEITINIMTIARKPFMIKKLISVKIQLVFCLNFRPAFFFYNILQQNNLASNQLYDLLR